MIPMPYNMKDQFQTLNPKVAKSVIKVGQYDIYLLCRKKEVINGRKMERTVLDNGRQIRFLFNNIGAKVVDQRICLLRVADIKLHFNQR